MKTATAAPGTNGGDRMWDRKLAFYHPTQAGTGAVLRLEPRFNRPGEERYNCFFLEMASQKTAANRSADGGGQATFGWEDKLTVKLGFADICELLAVMEGRGDKAGGRHDGLFHRNGHVSTIISLQKAEKGGFVLGLSRKVNGSDQATRVQIVLSEVEALGLRYVFQSALFFLAFHPQIMRPFLPPETTEAA